ncbi:MULTISPECIES: hypothetical protein [unclassified Rothia (in: high G+C Gram-positive bacteria)]|uniref:hypothetical protein n=1 Tax=unclassified Rothia (in: high G+C Gram-positive bacteria) TaxID=2689056 RepID=UPI0019579CF5|nr:MULTISPECIES: hypothetical protein [unclassified Rothia (in: high G+C Gram-positive bacteria)]MBM7051266.1 hypothetical protein [Rothia sp. ZJ1223]QRZ61062.1 hypothetical protein JR346_07315 [Rothia sp. ZJ932]
MRQQKKINPGYVSALWVFLPLFGFLYTIWGWPLGSILTLVVPYFAVTLVLTVVAIRQYREDCDRNS